MYSQEVKCIDFLLGQPDGFFLCFFFSIQYIMCFRASQGGGGQRVSSETGTPPRPHCAGLFSLTRPIFPCFLFWHSTAIFCSSEKKRPQVARQPVTKLFFFLAVLYFQFLVCEFDLIKTNHNIWPISAAIICSGRAGWYHQCWLCLLWLTCLLFPAAIELRFMPDPPTLNQYGVQRMNKSDNLELTCRYA